MSRRTITVSDAQLGLVLGELDVLDNPNTQRYRWRPEGPEGDQVGARMDGAVTEHLPALIADATPDRWGRRLIDRSMRGRTAREIDYLLGVSDDLRPGSLRFHDQQGNLLGADSDVPRMIDLEPLTREIKALVRDHDHSPAALLGMGSSSIGGAHPKAVARDKDGALWVVKFSPEDDPEKGADEHAALGVMRSLGVAAAETKVLRSGGLSLICSRRFDRDADGGRRGLRSLHSVLYRSGDGGTDDWADYVDVVPDSDHPELWRRAVVGALLHNTDDHSRNHALLRDKGWNLSPAYDVNPDFSLDTDHATGVLGERSWRGVAASLPELGEHCGVSRGEQVEFIDRATAAVSATRFRRNLPVSDISRAMRTEVTRSTISVPQTSGSGTCDVCGRPLSDPESIRRGRGPGCAKKV